MSENVNTIVAEERKGLLAHGIVTVCVVSLLIVINLIVSPQIVWSIFPTCGMSAGVALHYFLSRRTVCALSQ